jgi:palmitoyltransferase
MVFYISLAAIYANIFNYEFVSDVKGDNGWIMNVLSIIGPHVGWAFGYYSVYDVSIAVLTSVGYILNFLFLWLLIIQIRQILKGQTKYELKKGITTYSIGLKIILREIGGKYWFLVWISPLVPSPLPGDGISFEKFETKEL